MDTFNYDKYKARQKRLQEPITSVKKVYDQSSYLCDLYQQEKKSFCLMGVKDTDYIPNTLLSRLCEHGFVPHTLDKMARGGRAIDIDLVNPLTGRPMTGSSSGTAINVLEDYNDIGLGTDGGGSVLAPALSVNLYGLISPLFYRNEKLRKDSTDGISFVPSVGFIAKKVELLKEVTEVFVHIEPLDKLQILLPSTGSLSYEGKDQTKILEEALADNEGLILHYKEYPNIYGDRQDNIRFLEDQLKQYDVIMTYEGPVDYHGFGDSVFGLFNQASRANQEQSKKGLVRVANMVNASALVVPTNDFSSGYVLIANGNSEGLSALFTLEEKLNGKLDNKLFKRYFTIHP